ncbi:MAG: ABC transporter ATP-binding protein [Lachnospiraceae bacterium]|nr:ABC transporter ATP-binding protein [Lachnospiraceae bacterium]MDE6252294.1 ABC transporter ATP-binding protein [Lachnospiraceae bacterium]
MIKAANVTKTFDKFKALNNISCSIPKGCIYGMVGSNGAGKSTFLRLITGVYKPDTGAITIDDKNVWENPEVKETVSYVPDDLYFLPGANMERMAKLYAAVYNNFDMKHFNYLTKSFELNPKKSLNHFSKGMKRQAAIILALSCHSDYMFFDETFDGLDPVMRNLIKKLICEDVIERKATAIITSHSLRELEDTCDQLSLLHKGGLVLESDVANLKTSLFKIQIAFSEPYEKEIFSDIEMLHYSRHGSVANMIVRGDKQLTIARLKSMNPILMDVLPLSLEEVFTYEMEALGYSFENVVEGGRSNE